MASREGHLVDVLSYVHVRRLTPSPALLFNVTIGSPSISSRSVDDLLMIIYLLQSVVALAMIIPGDIEGLIDFFSFTAWIFYGAAMLALIVMRYTKKDALRPYKVQYRNQNQQSTTNWL